MPKETIPRKAMPKETVVLGIVQSYWIRGSQKFTIEVEE